MTKLFVSFTRTISFLVRGKITAEDLENGLFYFGCRRVHAYEPWLDGPNANELEWDSPEESKAAHVLLVAALTKAEAEGRGAWRETRTSYEQLLALLAANGVDCTGVDRDALGTDYCCPGVTDLMKDNNLPVRVVF